MNTENVNAPNERVDQFKDYLDTQGLRLTQERLTILDQVFNTDTHFRPDDLLVWMRQAGYKIYWRYTSEPQWQSSQWADNVSEFTLKNV
ncbi:TPA: hypothetical protein EYO77_19060, partial [Candidatus Poribacteria bacterium]|nr:hypothetical protein [Candidatus Poribacteria bacterium]